MPTSTLFRILGCLAVVLGAAFFSHSWVLGGLTKPDDSKFYAASADYLDELGQRIQIALSGDPLPKPAQDRDVYRKNFRPLVWAWMALESPDKAVPPGGSNFLIGLLIHCFLAGLAYTVAYSMRGWQCGLFAGVFYGVFPVGAQALSWASARGDILMSAAFATILALFWVYWERREGLSKRSSILFGLAIGAVCAVAIASKSHGLFCIPVVGAGFILISGPRRWWFALGSSLPILAIMGLRYIWLGTLLPVDYRNAESESVGISSLTDALVSKGDAVLSMLHTFAGGPRATLYGPFMEGAWWHSIDFVRYALPFLIAIAVGLILFQLRKSRYFVFLALSAMLMLVPTWFVWNTDQPAYYDRSLLPSIFPLSLILGMGLKRFSKQSKAGIRIAVALTTALILAGVAHCHFERRAEHDFCLKDALNKQAQLDRLMAGDEDVWIIGRASGWRADIVPALRYPSHRGLLFNGLSEDSLKSISKRTIAQALGIKTTSVHAFLAGSVGDPVRVVHTAPDSVSTWAPSAKSPDDSNQFILDNPGKSGASLALIIPITKSRNLNRLPQVRVEAQDDEWQSTYTYQSPGRSIGDITYLCLGPSAVHGIWRVPGKIAFAVKRAEVKPSGPILMNYSEAEALQSTWEIQDLQLSIDSLPQDVWLLEVQIIDSGKEFADSLRLYWEIQPNHNGPLQIDLRIPESISPIEAKAIWPAALEQIHRPLFARIYLVSDRIYATSTQTLK